ncbi:MAG: zinc ribbon domain-containing protein [Candidatus Xenobia bacterium]
MFFLLFGTRPYSKEVGRAAAVCPYCGDPGPHAVMQAENYFTLYFIPLFKTGGGGRFLRCRRCNQDFPQQAAGQPQTRVPEADWTWSCNQCGNVNPRTATACLKCGASM